jgi:hypothetical protein
MRGGRILVVRRWPLRKTAFVSILVLILGLAGLLQIASAGQGGEESPHLYVVVCHRTGSATNPFVLIVVAEESTQLGNQPNGGGHKESGSPAHEGDFFVPGFDPTPDHKAALAFAKENRGNELAVCVPSEKEAPPAEEEEGAVPVTG